ncbi:hypothetical protein Ndes2526B_g04846 [Nannochloris sp. 'desiccata']|nr:hypothetical protein KSW81_000449 [Chlorella desiccata (nom. nud.)]KAH7620914.1 hypothetical protein NADE_003523 [Chlorella desiccata (nom. nud.)]
MSDQVQNNASDSTVEWILNNKLKAIGYTWLAGISGSLAYQWSRPIPTSLKVIHSRVYAQAITLGALGAVAAIELYAQNKGLGTREKDEDEKK